MKKSSKKISEKFSQIKSHPATQQSLEQLKPKKTVWGILGVALFFILPEIIAFIWGDTITAYTQYHLSQPLSLEEEYKYKREFIQRNDTYIFPVQNIFHCTCYKT